MNIDAIAPLRILPSHSRPKIPHQPDAPNSDSSKYNLANVTDGEAVKLAVDLYNDGKISLHELGLMHVQFSSLKTLRQDEVSVSFTNIRPEPRHNLLEYAEMAVESCRSRDDPQGVKIFMHLLEVFRAEAQIPGRQISVSA